MHTHLARRTAANVRAALVIVAFTALAAVGFAAGRSLSPTRVSTARTACSGFAPVGAHNAALHAAPAACPMPAAAFRTH